MEDAMSGPKLRIALPERVEIFSGSNVWSPETGSGLRGTSGSNEVFRFNDGSNRSSIEKGNNNNNNNNGSGSGSGSCSGNTTPSVSSPSIGGGPAVMTPTSMRVLSQSGDSDKKKMVEQFYMNKPRRSSRTGVDSYFGDVDKLHGLMDPFLLQDETTVKDEEVSGLGPGPGPGGDKSSSGFKLSTGTNSGPVTNGGGNANGTDLLNGVRNGNISYDLFAINELRSEELISCLLNLDNIVMEEMGKKGGDDPDTLGGSDNNYSSSFAATSQILEWVVLDLHGSKAFKGSLLIQFETLDQIERYLQRLNGNLEQAELLLKHSTENVSGKFQKELVLSMSKLNELRDMLSSMDVKLSDAREEVNEQKHLLFDELGERLEVLDYIGSRFKAQARVTREWRVRQMYISLTTLILVLAIGVYYVQKWKQT